MIDGKESPCPQLDMETQIIVSQSGVATFIELAAKPPASSNALPRITVGLRRLLHVIKNPVLTLAQVTVAVAATNRRPDSVGDTSLTARKKRGALKIIVLMDMEPKKLPYIKLARGSLDRSDTGITGRSTWRSYLTKIIARMKNIIMDDTTK